MMEYWFNQIKAIRLMHLHDSHDQILVTPCQISIQRGFLIKHAALGTKMWFRVVLGFSGQKYANF